MWAALDGSSAAPTYFPSVRVPDVEHYARMAEDNVLDQRIDEWFERCEHDRKHENGTVVYVEFRDSLEHAEVARLSDLFHTLDQFDEYSRLAWTLERDTCLVELPVQADYTHRRLLAQLACHPLVTRIIRSALLIDGGVTVNQPDMCAYVEARRLWPDDTLLVLSIGTGRERSSVSAESLRTAGGPEYLFKGLFDIVMDETSTRRQMERLLGDRYLRVNTVFDGDVPQLDDTDDDTLQQMRALGDHWWQVFGVQIIEFVRKKYRTS